MIDYILGPEDIRGEQRSHERLHPAQSFTMQANQTDNLEQ